MIGENHQAGRKLKASESIYSLQSKYSIKVENNKEKTKINEFQTVCFEPWLQKGVTWNAANIFPRHFSLLTSPKAEENKTKHYALSLSFVKNS